MLSFLPSLRHVTLHSYMQSASSTVKFNLFFSSKMEAMKKKGEKRGNFAQRWNLNSTDSHFTTECSLVNVEKSPAQYVLLFLVVVFASIASFTSLWKCRLNQNFFISWAASTHYTDECSTWHFLACPSPSVNWSTPFSFIIASKTGCYRAFLSTDEKNVNNANGNYPYNLLHVSIS